MNSQKGKAPYSGTVGWGEGVRSGLVRTRGFTLIELIGVMSILTILASAVTLNVVAQMKRAARETEARNLETMRDALRDRILRTKQIGTPNQWAQAIADELAIPLVHANETRLGYARRFLVDPGLQIGNIMTGGVTLPYTQGMHGSIEPVNGRVMLISTLGAPLPGATNQAAFNAAWNSVEGQVPAGWTNWTGLGEDLWIQRMDLRSLFRRVVFNNMDPDNVAPFAVAGAPTFLIQGNPTAQTMVRIPAGQRHEAWFLETSGIRLHFADETLQAQEYVREDISYVFENGRWSRYLNYGKRPPLSGFGLLAENFRQSPMPPNSKFGANAQAVVEEVFTYLYTYGFWATGEPPYSVPFDNGGSTSDQQVPAYQALLGAQSRLDWISGNLIN
ncbi:MAG: type II secretion system protein [Verrucomicrobiae bacterium]|nr:type II secretion system protein [Verrucomicrobiae bacterium]